MSWLKMGVVAAVATCSGALITAATVAVASDSNATVQACVGKQVGSVRIVQTSTDCRNSEEPLDWNRYGPVGPPGPPGPSGVSGYEVVLAVSLNDAEPFKRVHAFCPPGKKVVGGGVNGVPVNEGGRLINSSPNHQGEVVNGDLRWNNWEGAAHVTTGEFWRLQVMAICIPS